MTEASANRVHTEEIAQQWRMTHRFALFLTHDAELAEELAQEAFRVALASERVPPNEAERGAWLRGVVRNLARNAMRKRRRQWVFFNSDAADAAERHFLASGGGRDAAWDERREALSGCMEKLPAPDRELVHTRYQDGVAVQDMAAARGVEPNTLSKRLERIREALRECIERALRREGNG